MCVSTEHGKRMRLKSGAQDESREVTKKNGGVKRNSEKKGKILTNIVHYNVN